MSLDFAAGSCFSEIFCTKSRETISECMQLFNCQSVKDVADKIPLVLCDKLECVVEDCH